MLETYSGNTAISGAQVKKELVSHWTLDMKIPGASQIVAVPLPSEPSELTVMHASRGQSLIWVWTTGSWSSPLEAEEVLQIELRNVQSRVSHATNRPFLFRISEEARQFLLDEGTDQRYEARHPKRAIERILIHPLARLLATDQLRSGDRLLIDFHPARNSLAFAKDTEHCVPYPGVVLQDAVHRTNVEV